MLIVDVNTLGTVSKLYLADKIVVNCIYAENIEYVSGVDRTFCDGFTLFNELTLRNSRSGTEGKEVFLSFACFFIGNDDVRILLDCFEGNGTVDFLKQSKILGLSCFEKLFDTGKTLCDVGA